MIKTLTIIIELLILALAFWLGGRLWWHRYSGIKKGGGMCCSYRHFDWNGGAEAYPDSDVYRTE